MSKKNIIVLFGGRSPEHEVSLRSAKNVVAAIDKNKYEAHLIGISKQGTWYCLDADKAFQNKSILDSQMGTEEMCSLICNKGQAQLLLVDSQKRIDVDVAFPVLHGPYGEDGTIQGLFRMCNLAFVGCDVLGSAAGMDKEVMKRLLKDAAIPSAPYMLLRKSEVLDADKVIQTLGLPFFIKPANAGSSVGVHKIKSKEDLSAKLKDAFKYDTKVLAEKFIKGREIEVAVLGSNNKPKAALPGEIIPTHEFYSYEAKYVDENGAHLKIPAELDSAIVKKIQETAIRTFQIMECDGLTRVDFFLTEANEIYVNEINTLPGFTNISMYPKMWESSGVKYSALISELIEIATARHQSLREIETSFESL